MQAKAEGLSGKGDLYQFWGSRLYESVLDKSGTGKISPIKEGDVIDLGDRPLKIIDLPGHTPGSIAVLDVKNRVLISGDSVQDSNIYMFGPRRNIEDYIVSLRHLRNFKADFDLIFPSHGTFPLQNGQIEKLLAGAEDIVFNRAAGSEMELFGNKTVWYKFDYAGFYCDLPKEVWGLLDENGNVTGEKFVRCKDCYKIIPQGRYHLVVDATVVHKDGTILMTKRSNEKDVYPGYWEPRAGGSAVEGESAEVAATRELFEETGIRAGKMELINVSKSDNHGVFLFLCNSR